MKTSRFEQIYAGLILFIFGLIVLHAPISVGFGVLFPDFDLLIKSWKEILMIIALPLGLAIITYKKLWPLLLRDPAFYVLVSYVVIHLVLAGVMFESSTATLAGLAIDLRYILFFSLVYMLATTLPSYRTLFIKTGVGGAIIVVGFAVLQLFLPADILIHIGYGKDTIAPYLTVDKNPDFVRINSTMRGPNPLGAYVTIILSAVAAAWMTYGKRFGWPLIILGCAGVAALWATYSRSAVAATVIAVMIIGLVVYGRKMTSRNWAVVGIATVAVMAAFIAVRDSDFVSNVVLHENPDGGSSISSNEQHAESLAEGLSRMVSQPFGAGIGSTGSASLYTSEPVIIENQYLFIAHESGWLGLGLFMTLFVMVLERLWRRRSDWLALAAFASGIGLGLICLIQPVWVDDTVSIVWWGLAALAIAKGVKRGRSTK